ncbi:efflux RND transporter periplasmic adaptor subunit [Agarivorans sp. 1_MG-2023]|uniref:efflux RND transporter periplasmic adaptor subunit n=1 Tax=Agarivorans sp. 1_MG-2023 TaxID=3062634 RepID=UPI0026E355F3|nr:efflux RND transporter periplasmic adaptor subunit [Agarivorans sp. 1_MG-2023]MDO6762819.1 efflux RND transporter periplasmic adaptor subunit [Agarivorans sp. 1_MG-2023]
MKKNAITLAITLAAAGAIFVVVGYNGSQMAQAKGMPGKPAPAQEHVVEVGAPASVINLPAVSVQATGTGSYQAEVIAYGETKSRFELEFTSEVSGRVVWLADNFETGEVIKQGAVVAQLDDSAYQQALTQAKADVADARLALLEEQRQGEQAESEWLRSGLSGEPASPLVLRKPQLTSAKAQLVNAQQALASAEKDLDDTKIKAPFDALVVVRNIQPGSYLTAGSNVATFYSVDRIEVEVPLSESQWENLPSNQDFSQWNVELSDSSSSQTWAATVVRAYQHLDHNTRQRSLIVAVDKPLEQNTPLFAGTFVQATLSGSSLGGLWELPASAISQQGDIWLVDEQNLLQKATAKPVFERQNKVYVKPLTDKAVAQVVMRPLSNFNVGMKVTPSEDS